MTMTETPNKNETFDESAHYTPKQLCEMADVRPQMVYNYMSAGYIPFVLNDDGKKRIRKDVGDAWVDGYLTRKRERLVRKQRQIEAELEGKSAPEQDNKEGND